MSQWMPMGARPPLSTFQWWQILKDREQQQNAERARGRAQARPNMQDMRREEFNRAGNFVAGEAPWEYKPTRAGWSDDSFGLESTRRAQAMTRAGGDMSKIPQAYQTMNQGMQTAWDAHARGEGLAGQTAQINQGAMRVQADVAQRQAQADAAIRQDRATRNKDVWYGNESGMQFELARKKQRAIEAEALRQREFQAGENVKTRKAQVDAATARHTYQANKQQVGRQQSADFNVVKAQISATLNPKGWNPYDKVLAASPEAQQGRLKVAEAVQKFQTYLNSVISENDKVRQAYDAGNVTVMDIWESYNVENMAKAAPIASGIARY